MERMQGSALDIRSAGAAVRERLARSYAQRQLLELSNIVDGAEHVVFGGRQEGKTRLAEDWLRGAHAGGARRVLVTVNESVAGETNMRVGAKGDAASAVSFRRLLKQGAEEGVQYGFDETLSILEHVFGLHEPPRLVTVLTAAPWQGTPDGTWPEGGEVGDEPLLRYLDHEHLPEGSLKETSRLFAVVARKVVEDLPRSPERTVALRKLLESKDAAVRAALDIPTG